MSQPRLTSRAEWPWVLLPCVAIMAGWWLWNQRSDPLRRDLSEGGTLHVITYGSDLNPVRQSQIDIFDRTHREAGLAMRIVPGGSEVRSVITTSAGGNAQDVLEASTGEDLRLYARKGIAVRLNAYLDEAGIDLEAISWPGRIEDCRLERPDWKPGDDPKTRWDWYAVPNNHSVQMVWFNRTLYRTAFDERVARTGSASAAAMPPEPWVDWTWWDYLALGQAMHRPNAGGGFLSFGVQLPPIEDLAYQIILAKRGDDRAAYDAFSDDVVRARGLWSNEGRLSFDALTTIYRRRDEAAPGAQGASLASIFPVRSALAEAVQFNQDAVYVLRAAPTPSDADAMATAGGWNTSGDSGRWLSGLQGCVINGRWWVGQVRANAGFDWRLCRLPRYVPYAEWARWQAEGKGPGRRDGPYGDADPATRQRGYGAFIDGRMAFITSSCRHPKRAFAFLRFLVENPDFNRALLIEDGFGAHAATARAYLAIPDPDRPDEHERRSVAMELGALDRLARRPIWPWDNYRSGKRRFMDTDAGSIMGETRKELAAPTVPQSPVSYPEFFPDATQAALAGRQSHADFGSKVADRMVKRLEELARVGEVDRALQLAAPSLPTFAFFAALAGIGVLLWSMRDRLRAGKNADEPRQAGGHG